MDKSKRKLIISAILTFLILAAGMVGYRTLGSKKKSTISRQVAKEVLREVETSTIPVVSVNKEIAIDGRLQAFEKVNLFSEVSGPLLSTSKPFKEGTYFEKGDLLFEIDDEEARLNLLAQRASLQNAITQIMPDLKFDYPDAFEKWKGYLDNYDVNQPVAQLPEPSTQQEKYYIGGKNLHTQYYQIKSLENKMKDYKIYAPFNGVVTNANIFTGALVSPGANLGTFMNTGLYELVAPIRLEDLEFVRTGQTVTLKTDGMESVWKGRVSRISRVLEERTQSLPIYITVSGRGLREGMYLNGTLKGGKLTDVMLINRDLVRDQTNVLAVTDSIINRVPIEIVGRNDDTVYAKGLPQDQRIITSNIDGLFAGQKVIEKMIDSPVASTMK